MPVPYYEGERATLHLGDCLDVMRELPAESVDAVVTSPPYAEQRKSTYGGIPEAEYPEWSVAWMREARRLLKPDGSVILNISPHKVRGGLSDYVLRTRLAIRADGWTELDEMIWLKPNAMPTGAPQRPRRSWESLLWFGKHGRAYSNAKECGQPSTRPTGMHYGQAQRNGWEHDYKGGNKTPRIARCTNVATVSSGSETTGHPAPFPVALAEWCGRLVCPPGGTILDPFSGSASTGVAAIRNGRTYVGIDNVEDYVEQSARRLEREAQALSTH